MASRVQVLVAAMGQTDHSLLEKLNVQSDALVGNQCDFDRIEHFVWQGHDIAYFSFNERGVGLNRNNTWMRATGEMCLFADDDMRYVDGYAQIVANTFDRLPQADVLVFGAVGKGASGTTPGKARRLHFFNCLRYGIVRVAVRTQKVREQGIAFNLCFGGGTQHSHGEDTLFLVECLKHGLKVYAVPDVIFELTNERPSTWFRGYTDKYFRDKGVLFGTISRRWQKLLCLQDAVRKHSLYGLTWRQAYRKMTEHQKDKEQR